jgi:FkbM family methyltransferase
VVTVPIGPYWIAMLAQGTLHQTLANHPDYNGELARLVKTAITKYPDLAMIDVGANVGDTAAIAKIAADIPVFCIEGDPHAFKLLQQNIRQFSNVQARNALLGERPEEISVHFQKVGWNLTVVPTDGPSTTRVALTTLDECVRDLDTVERYRLLKVDTEGFDCRILRGGMSYIERVKPMIMMEYNRENMDQIGEPGLPTLVTLRGIGYRDILVYDESGRLLLATTLAEEELLRDLHAYAPGKDSDIYYYDLCLFHSVDADIAAAFTRDERVRRDQLGP